MKVLKLINKAHGEGDVILDDEIYDFIIKNKLRVRLKYDKTINGFYVYIGLEALHRLLTECPKGMVVDHINRNTLDNRLCNLRICTTKENNNNRKVRCTCKTGYPGIHKDKYTGKYITRITLNSRRYYIGKYSTLEEAIEKQNERRSQLALQI